MHASWKQIWHDIRTALRDPAQQKPDAAAATALPPPDRATVTSAVPDAAPIVAAPAPANLVEAASGGDFPVSNARQPWGVWGAGVGVVLTVAILLWLSGWGAQEPTPPAPNVVATFTGGQITIEDLQQHWALFVPATTAPAEGRDLEMYRMVLQEMISDQLIRQWAATRKADGDEKLQHVMKHITEEINLDELHTQMHKDQMGVAEGDIQAYYEANRAQFGDQTLSQAREQIRSTLEATQEDQFVANYIKGLKDKATITRDFDLLVVPEPTERTLQTYYTANLDQYMQPAQVVVDEVQIPIGTNEPLARQTADKALVRLRAGEAFTTIITTTAVLGSLSLPSRGVSVRAGTRAAPYDEVVFNLDLNELSDVFRSGDAFYIVQLRSRRPERQATLDEVRTQVRQAVLQEQMRMWFDQNADRTLFTIHGKRYTVGEFWLEYQELPATFLAQYESNEGRKQLAEQIIERLLLVEDSYDRLLTNGKESELEEIRLDVLAQMMEQEEVDDQLTVTDEEVQTYYDENQAMLVTPPQARIRQILIRLGQTEDERQRAWEKANAAYQKVAPGLFQQGEDFAEVARQYSEDAATAANGGEVAGWISEGADLFAELTEHPLHQQLLALAVGDISPPFEANNAIYLIQVLERQAPQPLIFDEIKELLREELRAQKHDERLHQYQEKLATEANVTIYDRVLGAAFGTGPTAVP
ncbi:MAG: peptidyl-prolyl cis-trans isomerase [Caldilineaceae bacterium]|nr:peptidyl-prolyl cis-trans isomerase [Caldilineaceae bacterium]